MTAIKVGGKPVLLPRVNQKKPVVHGTIEEGPGGVRFYSNASRSLRYQHLPDFDPNENDEQIRAKLKERFEILRLMTRDAIEQRVRAMIVSGPGGVGKTFAIDEELERWDPSGEKYTSHSGYLLKTGLYKLLWKHREEGDIVKIDDADSIFENTDALNFIKIATDTTQKRILAYGAETTLLDENEQPIPRVFEYKGTMLFITNLDFDALIDKGNKLSPHLEAMITRSHYIDLMMRTKRDYLLRVFDVAEEGLFNQIEGITDEHIDKVLEFIDQYYRTLRECSLRMAIKIAKIVVAHDEGSSISWERKALISCCRGVV